MSFLSCTALSYRFLSWTMFSSALLMRSFSFAISNLCGHRQRVLHFNLLYCIQNRPIARHTSCFGKCIDRIKSFGREFHFAGMKIYERSDTKIEALTVRLLKASLLEENNQQNRKLRTLDR